MYHDIYNQSKKESGFDNSGANLYKIKYQQFYEQLEQIKSNHFITITFDDGGISAKNIAVKLLNHLNIKAIFFVSTDFIDTKGFLSSKDIQDLFKMGHIIGSHSCSHPKDISRLNQNQLYNEWSESKFKLEKIINSKIHHASIPAGKHDKKVLNVLNDLQYTHVYTSIPGYDSFIYKNLIIYKRIVVKSSTTLKQFKNLLEKPSLIHYLRIRYTFIKVIRHLLGSNFYKLRNLILKYV